MSEQQENPQKSISERIDAILGRLSKDQIRFVVALQDYSTKKDAAHAIGLQPDTVYRWNGEIEEAAQLMAQERLEGAKAIRRRALVEAISVKVAGLKSNDERVRQSVATEIIEWELGKAQQHTDVTSGGKPIESDADPERYDRAVSSLADALGKAIHSQGTGEDGSMAPTE